MFILRTKSYTKDFKMQAVKLVLQENIKVAVVAEKFGVHPVVLYRWVSDYKEFGDDAFVGSGHQHAADAALRKLRKQNEMLQMENEILKKAAAYFAKKHGKD